MSASSVIVDIDIKAITEGITRATDEVCRKLASEVAADARKSADFIDKTGTLRKSIKMRKGKYGGYLAKATAPHAHLIEYGHRNRDGSISAPRPFMRTAKDKILTDAHIKETAEKILKKQGY
jgi:hypothetical protein